MSELGTYFSLSFLKGQGGDDPVPVPDPPIPGPDPIPGGGEGGFDSNSIFTSLFSSSSQTGDWLGLLIAVLFAIFVIAVISFMVFRTNNSATEKNTIALSQNKILMPIIIFSIAGLLCFAATSINAIANPNHIEPLEKPLPKVDVTGYVDENSGEITIDTSKIFTPEEPIQDYNLLIQKLAVQLADGYEDYKFNLTITASDGTNEFTISDSYVPFFDYPLAYIKPNYDIHFKITDIDPELAKSLIDKGEVIAVYLFYNGSEEPFPDISKVIVPETSGYTITPQAAQKFQQNGWDYINTNEGSYYAKDYPFNSSTEQILEFLNKLGEDKLVKSKDSNYQNFTGVYNEDGLAFKYLFVPEIYYYFDFAESSTKNVALNLHGGSISDKGEEYLNQQGWNFNAGANRWEKTFDYNLTCYEVLKGFKAEHFIPENENYKFNYISPIFEFPCPAWAKLKVFDDSTVEFFVIWYSTEEPVVSNNNISSSENMAVENNLTENTINNNVSNQQENTKQKIVEQNSIEEQIETIISEESLIEISPAENAIIISDEVLSEINEVVTPVLYIFALLFIL